MFQRIITLIGLVLCITVHAEVNLTSLNQNGFSSWEPKSFANETAYEVTSHKERMCIKAFSDKAASGYVLKQEIDLLETPYINWSWLVEKALPKLDEKAKAGDDYSARVYVVVDGGLFVWKTKALNYVWSGSQAQGQVWDNAFAGSNAKMIAVRGEDAKTGQWYEEKRNVYEDLIQFFGDKGDEEVNQKSYRYIDIIAIMTDTDNSQGQAEAYYGDIIFSAE